MIFTIHKFLGLIFAIYILVDRLYLRRNVEKEKREIFYKKSKIPMLILSIGIALSGGYLFTLYEVNNLLLLKAGLGLLLIALFFGCPIAMMKLNCDPCKMRYRALVSLLLLVVLFLGVAII